MRTRQKIESELEASERDKAIARFCEVVADYGLPTPIDIQTEFDGANRVDTLDTCSHGSSARRRVWREVAD